MRDVARVAGVSPTTVSFVINEVEGCNIARTTRDRVLGAVDQLGYRPNALARGLRRNRTDTIGLLSDEIATTTASARMIVGAQDAAIEHGNLLLLVNTGGSPDIERRAIAMLVDHRVDGIVYAAANSRVVAPPEDVRSVPTVLLGARECEGSLPSVVPDESSGALAAISVLLGSDHQRIGLLIGTGTASATDRGVDVYRSALAERGLPLDRRLVCLCDDASRGGYEGTRSLLGGAVPPTALVCSGDQIALGAYQALFDLGLRIPDDVAVVGFDDHDELIAPSLRPPLSTVALPRYAMGRWAVEHVLELIAAGDPRPPATARRMPYEYVARESV